MPESKRPLKVFLCHAHSDKDAVKALYDRLTNDGVDAWLDKEKLLPGQDWELEIRKAVREADVVVVCLSKQFNEDGFRQKEVRWALDTAMEKTEGEIFIIPARLEECGTLESLSKWHWVDLFEEDGYELLVRAVRARADTIGVILRAQAIGQTHPPQFSKQILFTPIHSSTQENKFNPKDYGSKRKYSLKKLTSKSILTFWGIFVLLALILSIWLPSIPTPWSTSTLTSTHDVNAQPGNLPTEIIDAKGIPMRMVPAGVFTMGSNANTALAQCQKFHNDCQRSWFIDEEPPHKVDLTAFYIDKYEVTNAFYQFCVDEGKCEPPKSVSSATRSVYYGNSQYDNYPVVNINWSMAKTYCDWRDARLPTEAEWEKAARGTDGRIYPWGNGIDASLVNYGQTIGDTSAVGNYEGGKSIYGTYDMAGNVWEWVSDWYSEYYYSSLNENVSNPQGPATGKYRILRGGSLYSNEYYLSSTFRYRFFPDDTNSFIGFRCAHDITP